MGTKVHGSYKIFYESLISIKTEISSQCAGVEEHEQARQILQLSDQ